MNSLEGKKDKINELNTQVKKLEIEMKHPVSQKKE